MILEYFFLEARKNDQGKIHHARSSQMFSRESAALSAHEGTNPDVAFFQHFSTQKAAGQEITAEPSLLYHY
jgi:hypothetical protein